MRLITTCFVLTMLSLSVAIAQTEYSTWIFGTSAGLTFNDGNGGILDRPRVISSLPIDTREGSSAYTHPCMDSLTLYAMGETAYDGTGRVLPNGTQLSGGSSSSQGALWVRDPSRPFSVYLFITPDMTDVSTTGSQVYTLNRAELDADGRWSMVERDIVLDPRPGSERIAGTHDAAGTGYWVVTQFTDSAASSVEFVAHHITSSGLDPVKVVSRFAIATLPQQAGIMKFSPNGRLLAMTNVSRPEIAVYDFDPSTGLVSFQRVVTILPDPTWQRISFAYGLTFSASGEWTFIAVRAIDNYGGAISAIVRFFSAGLVGTQWRTAETIVSNILTNQYPTPLQLGPNGKIYYINGDYIGEIERADEIYYQNVTVRNQEYRITRPSRTRLGLPTCIESTYDRPTPTLSCGLPTGSITGTDTCAGGCISITQKVSGSPTSWKWRFEGGQPLEWFDSVPPRVCYSTAGRYLISLTITNDVGAIQVVDSVTIHPNPTVKAEPVASLCVGGQVRLYCGGAKSYQWFPAELVDRPNFQNPLTVPLTQRTVFTVIGTNEYGCIGIDSVVVTPGDLQGTITADTAICQGETLSITASGGTSCFWLDDTTMTSYSRIVAPTRTTMYSAVIMDQGCTDTVRMTVTVTDMPILSISTDTVICGGSIVRLYASTDAPLVRWEPADLVDDPVSKSPTARVSVPTRFYVTATTFNGCSTADSVFVNVLAAGATAQYMASTCKGDPVDVLISEPGPITWLNGASEVVSIGQGLYRFSPTVSTVYVGTYESSDECPDTVRCSVAVTDSRTIRVQFQSTSAEVGQDVEFQIRVETNTPGGRVQVQLPTQVGVVWQAPWNTPFLIAVDSLFQRESVRGLVVLNGDQQRTVAVQASSTDGCSIVETIDGTLVVTGCAIESRHVLFNQPIAIRSAGNSVHITASGKIDVAIYDLLGRRLAVSEGSDHITIDKPHDAVGPVIIYATSRGQANTLMVY